MDTPKVMPALSVISTSLPAFEIYVKITLSAGLTLGVSIIMSE